MKSKLAVPQGSAAKIQEMVAACSTLAQAPEARSIRSRWLAD